MSDLISRSALIKAMDKKYKYEVSKGFCETGFATGFCSCEEMVRYAPTVEARPVVHGEWEQLCDKYFSTKIPTISRCSVCGKKYNLANLGYNFCPECGASMKADMRGWKND